MIIMNSKKVKKKKNGHTFWGCVFEKILLIHYKIYSFSYINKTNLMGHQVILVDKCK